MLLCSYYSCGWLAFLTFDDRVRSLLGKSLEKLGGSLVSLLDIFEEGLNTDLRQLISNDAHCHHLELDLIFSCINFHASLFTLDTSVLTFDDTFRFNHSLCFLFDYTSALSLTSLALHDETLILLNISLG